MNDFLGAVVGLAGGLTIGSVVYLGAVRPLLVRIFERDA